VPQTRVTTPSTTIVCCLIVVACSHSGHDEDASTAGRTGNSQEPAAAWELVLKGDIGGGSTTGEDVFGSVADVDIDPAGRVYVLDRFDKEIRVFDTSGVYLRTIGRQGSGPGELKSPTALDWGPGLRLWVLDGGNGRFTVFDTAGAYVGQVRRGGGTLQDFPWLGNIDAAGNVYEDGWEFDPATGLGRSFVVTFDGGGGGALHETSRYQLPYFKTRGLPTPW